jgi:hypothetical protein
MGRLLIRIVDGELVKVDAPWHKSLQQAAFSNKGISGVGIKSLRPRIHGRLGRPQIR